MADLRVDLCRSNVVPPLSRSIGVRRGSCEHLLYPGRYGSMVHHAGQGCEGIAHAVIDRPERRQSTLRHAAGVGGIAMGANR